MAKKPLILMILDGFGVAPKRATPLLRQTNRTWTACFKITRLLKSALPAWTWVLPDGQMGNNEVGHTNIGAGRIVYQELTRITEGCQDGELAKNEALLNAVNNAKKNGAALHFIGLLSDGGVHSHITHLCPCWKWPRPRAWKSLRPRAAGRPRRSYRPHSGKGLLGAGCEAKMRRKSAWAKLPQ